MFPQRAFAAWRAFTVRNESGRFGAATSILPSNCHHQPIQLADLGGQLDLCLSFRRLARIKSAGQRGAAVDRVREYLEGVLLGRGPCQWHALAFTGSRELGVEGVEELLGLLAVGGHCLLSFAGVSRLFAAAY